MRKLWRNLNILLFFLYAGLLLWMLLGRAIGDLSYREHITLYSNFVPFETIRLYLRQLIRPVHPIMRQMAVYNLLGNILLFVPLGFCPPMLWPGFRHFLRTVLTVALVISVAELLQLLLRVGSCDIDDLILNVLGAAIGYGLFRLLHPAEI